MKRQSTESRTLVPRFSEREGGRRRTSSTCAKCLEKLVFFTTLEKIGKKTARLASRSETYKYALLNVIAQLFPPEMCFK